MRVCDHDRMDTGTHLRAIWRRRWLVLAAATALALVVLLLRASQAPIYSTSSDLFLVVPQSSGDATATNDRLTASYSELIRDERIVADLLRRSALPLSPADVRADVSVASPGSGQLTVTARESTPERSARLANAAALSLSAGADGNEAEVVKRQLAPLQSDIDALTTQLETVPGGSPAATALNAQIGSAASSKATLISAPRVRLDVVRPADPLDATHTPNPVRDAVLAFLLGFIVAAEAAALLAARRRGLEGRDPVPSLEAWSALPVFRVGPNRYGPDEGAAALRFLQAGSPGALYLVPVLASPASGVAVRTLLQLLADAPDRASWLPLSAELGGPAGPAGVDMLRSPAELPATEQSAVLVSAPAWEDPALLALAETAPGRCALIVDAGRVREPQLREALRVLGYADLSPQLLLVVESAQAGWWPWRRTARAEPQPPLLGEASAPSTRSVPAVAAKATSSVRVVPEQPTPSRAAGA